VTFLSPAKLLIILVLGLILLGPDKLPEVARQLGAGWRAVRSFHEKVETELRETVPDLPSTTEIARFARSPVSFLNSLADQHLELKEDLVADPGAPAGPAVPEDGAAWPADSAAPTTDGHRSAHGFVPGPPAADRVDEGAGRQPVPSAGAELPVDPSLN
jgi:sec-independent protein translocase protein TatB